MTNPISVLLIIGSAVVGPIDGKIEWFPPETAGVTTICVVPDHAGKLPKGGIPCVARRETLPQLCERAMRETGLGEGRILIGQERRVTQQTARYDSHTTIDQFAFVRCIPTPEGYRK
jgi:hypothetical protein